MSEAVVQPPVLRWAQRRGGHDDGAMRNRLGNWDQWLTREKTPHFSDIARIAHFTRVPLGYLFLPEPPQEDLPIPDLRSGRGSAPAASDELLDTIYLNQRRQAWYEDHLAEVGDLAEVGAAVPPLPFVGSARNAGVEEAASRILHALDYGIHSRRTMGSAEQARNHLIEAFENLGGLVVVNSMVENNTHRPLDLGEFRGFTLHSTTAPLVFVNGKDTKRGQIFSLLHEFAHVWRGESAVSAGGDPMVARDHATERWCDAVAAQIAVPSDDLRRNFDPDADLTAELDRLSIRYWCSTLVILIRLRETGHVSRECFADIYADEVDRLLHLQAEVKRASGGSFYANQAFRVGRTLSRELIADTLRGATPMTEALRLLSFTKTSVFDGYADHLGMV